MTGVVTLLLQFLVISLFLMIMMKRKPLFIGCISGTIVLATIAQSSHQGAAQQSLRVRVDRWLMVQRVVGSVTRTQGGNSWTARVGDRLQGIGDSITTGKTSSTILAVDTGIGFVDVGEQTRVRVQEMTLSNDNGRVTRLEVPQGQVRLRVRRFNHRGSQLEIRTPASLSGVRGTEFGVGVQPNGKTGLAVLEGRVATGAKGRSVSVPGGYQNFTIPGQAPSPAVPLRDDPRLRFYRFDKQIVGGIRHYRLLGQVDTVNTVLVNGAAQVTDRNGRFQTSLQPAPSYPKIQVIVTTPLGKKQTYELALR